MGKIFFAGKEAQEGPSLVRDVVANGSSEHRVLGFEFIKDRALRDRTLDLECEFAADARQVSEMEWEYDSDHSRSSWNGRAEILGLGSTHQAFTATHAIVCTSTESTAGRSRTIGAQLSPPSGDA